MRAYVVLFVLYAAIGCGAEATPAPMAACNATLSGRWSLGIDSVDPPGCPLLSKGDLFYVEAASVYRGAPSLWGVTWFSSGRGSSTLTVRSATAAPRTYGFPECEILITADSGNNDGPFVDVVLHFYIRSDPEWGTFQFMNDPWEPDYPRECGTAGGVYLQP